MKLELWYERAKKYCWPHLLIPLAVLVLIDWLRLLLLFAQFAVVIFVGFQTMFLFVGFFAGMMIRFSRRDEEPWKEIMEYRLAKVFPMLPLGKKLFDWIMAGENTDDEPPLPTEEPVVSEPPLEPEEDDELEDEEDDDEEDEDEPTH